MFKRNNQVTIGLLAFLTLLQAASAQYPGWQHSGSLYILTTPEGANLPAKASDQGTAPAAGVIGKCRRFSPGT